MNTNSLTRIIISCLIGAASCSSAMAQKLASGAVAIDNLKTHVEGNKVDVAFSLHSDACCRRRHYCSYTYYN